MTTIKSFYLSRILGDRVCTTDGKIIGKLIELVATNEEPPHVVSCIIKSQDGTIRFFDWAYFSITKVNKKYQIDCTRNLELESGK